MKHWLFEKHIEYAAVVSNLNIGSLWGCMVAMLLATKTVIAETPVSFSREIRPILSENCFACHGPDEKGRKAGLRLDDEVSAKQNHDGMIAIVPGKPLESELMRRIESSDANDTMPPLDSHKRLTSPQKELFKIWIEQGANWGKHWAFEPVLSPPVPANGEKQPIDAFIRSRLAHDGLSPSPKATRETLIRRVTLDLTGLPPTPDEVNSFVNDRSEKSFEKVIDRLFASPHYGERMAVDWLDAARFADTQGYQVDRDQDMHPWRDWVIASYNKNMPFDQFTIEQLAGDLLPEPTLEQRIATGFHRNHMVNQEGGIISAEFIAEYTADRVETTAAVWLGQTFNCTRCHDHKFDPFTQKDFYSLKAFFNNVGEQGEGAQDLITLPSKEIEERLKPLLSEVTELQERLEKQIVTELEIRDWADRLSNAKTEWHPLEITRISAKQGHPTISADARSFHLNIVTGEQSPLVATLQLPKGKIITAFRLECSSADDAAKVNLRNVSMKSPGNSIELVGAVEAKSLKAIEADKVLKADRKSAVNLQPGSKKPADALVWQLKTPLDAPAETAIAVSPTAKTPRGNAKARTAAVALAEVDFSIVITSNNRETDWQLLYTEGPADQLVTQGTLDIASKHAERFTPSEMATMKREYLLIQSEAREARARINKLNDSIATIRKVLPSAIVMNERDKPKDTFILMRGVYDQLGEKVVAATPLILPPLPKDASRNRLGLAQWLVDNENPLTARVTVNRLWQSIFGIGLVRTSEDFGSQGQAPSHPELLDWLASEFMRSGWNIQHMLRLILTSDTYQQSARIPPSLRIADPENRLLARGPRFRLNAEFVRDQALAAGGLLSRKIGGKSAKPYHPPGLYELVTAGSTTNTYVEDKDEGLYRRSLYTYWKRSVPHPAMIAFDAPGREVCALRRTRSNTPLQSLNLMNDPTYVEAARHLAVRMINAAPGDVNAQIHWGYRILLAREATAAEQLILSRSFDRNHADFIANPAAAVGLLSAGISKADPNIEPAILAAMTNVASTMLCLDETVTKE